MPTEKPRLKGSDEILSSLGAPVPREQKKESPAPAPRRRAASSRAPTPPPEPEEDRAPLDFGKYKLPELAEQKPAPAEPQEPPASSQQELQQQLTSMLQPEPKPQKRRGRPKKQKPAEEAAPAPEPELTPILEQILEEAEAPLAEAAPLMPSAHIVPEEAVQEYSFEDFDAQEELRQKREEEERLAREAEEAERRRQQEEARLARKAREQERRRQEEEARRLKEAEEAERRRQEEEARLAREAREEERRRQEEEVRRLKAAEEERRRLVEEEETRRRLMEDEQSRDAFMQMLASEFESKFQEKYAEPLPQRRKADPESEEAAPATAEDIAEPEPPEPESPPEPERIAPEPIGPAEPEPQPEPEPVFDREEPEEDVSWFEQLQPEEDADPEHLLEADLFVEQFAEEARREEEVQSESFKDTLAEKFMRERERYLRELAINLEMEKERAQQELAEEEAEPEPEPPPRRRLDFRIQPEMHNPGAELERSARSFTYGPDASLRYQAEEPELPEAEPEPVPEPEPPRPKTAEERLMELANGLPNTPRPQRRPEPQRPPEPIPEPEPEPEKPRSRVGLIARIVLASVFIAAVGMAGFHLRDRFLGEAPASVSDANAPLPTAADEPYKIYETRTATERETHADVMIMRPGVTLRNFHVTNYLIVEDVPDAGTVTLENVTVDGAIYLRSSAIDILELYDVKAARIIVNNSQKPVEIRATGNTDIGTVEVKSAAALRQLAVEDTALGIQNVVTEAGDTPLDLRMEGLSLHTLVTGGDNVVNFISSSAQSMTSDGSLSLYGVGQVTNLALSDPEQLNVLVKDIAVANITAKSPGSINLTTSVDTMAIENPTELGGAGSIGSLTVNPKHESTRMTIDIAGLNVQLMTVNAESLLNCTGSAQLNTVVANASTNLRGNKVNYLQANDDYILYEQEPDRISTAAGVRPPQSTAENPNADPSQPASSEAEAPSVPEDGVSTLCGHTRETGGFTAGDGSVNAPYEIASAVQLAHISAHPSSHYVQTANIDISDESRYSAGFDMICADGTAFSGSYDGAGYAISNLRIASVKENVGLFAENIGTIRNVAIVSGEVASTSTPRANVGAVAGLNYGNGIIEACSNGARVTARPSSYAGGIAGYNFGGKIRDCYNTAKIAGGVYAGGITGVNLQSATLARSYNVGIIETEGTAGAVAGSSENAVVTNCYFLEETAVLGIGSGTGTVFSRTTEEMTSPQLVADLAAGDDTAPWAAGDASYQFPVLAQKTGE